jgi:DNA-directed RNA polymerase specialized sigma24 family protein
MNGLTVAATVSIAVPDNHAERLSTLFDRHYQRLYRLARRLTSCVDDALDLVQDVFLKAARLPSAIPVRWHLSIARRDLARVLSPHRGDNRDQP